MNLAEAFRTLDHAALDTIYDALPFVRTLSRDGGSRSTASLAIRQADLAEALLLARDSFVREEGEVELRETAKRGRLTRHSVHEHNEESEDDESDDEEETEEEEMYQETTIAHQNSTLVNAEASAQDIQQVLPQQPKSTVFIVPPTVNPYDPTKDYLPQWLKRTYMYWRWTLKYPLHDVPQRYAVWITLHLNDTSIRFHIQNVSTYADEGRFATSSEVNDFILRKAAGHIKVQEDLARLEFNTLHQQDSTSVISFNARYLRVFNKVRHYYNEDRLAIQYYDRILPRIRKRLNVNFYERLSTTGGLERIPSRGLPSLEGLMLAAEQVDDFYRPLPPVPPAARKKGFPWRRLSQDKLKMA